MSSIHTLTWRVTAHHRIDTLEGRIFQSTPSRRGWRSVLADHAGQRAISIHTLTQRVTRCYLPARAGITDFNPHPHAEGDCAILDGCGLRRWFQSTPSRRGWRRHGRNRPYVRDISIHTLTQRVTTTGIRGDVAQDISIHTLTQRVTRYDYRRKIKPHDFNPHPHAEGDPQRDRARARLHEFQSTPSRRGWLLSPISWRLSRIISIHTLTQRVTKIKGCVIYAQTISIHTLTQRVTFPRQLWQGFSVNFNPHPHAEGDKKTS